MGELRAKRGFWARRVSNRPNHSAVPELQPQFPSKPSGKGANWSGTGGGSGEMVVTASRRARERSPRSAGREGATACAFQSRANLLRAGGRE